MGAGPSHPQPRSLWWAPLLELSPMVDRLWGLEAQQGPHKHGVPHSRRAHMGVHRSSNLSRWVAAHSPTGPLLVPSLGCVPHSPGHTLKPGCSTTSSRSLPGLDWELE